jgi:hypothetical protein
MANLIGSVLYTIMRTNTPLWQHPDLCITCRTDLLFCKATNRIFDPNLKDTLWIALKGITEYVNMLQKLMGWNVNSCTDMEYHYKSKTKT